MRRRRCRSPILPPARVLLRVAADGPREVAARYAAARAAQPRWAATPMRKRIAAIEKFRELHRRADRDARADADAGSRQADPPVAQRAERPARPARLLPRRIGARAARAEGVRRCGAEARRADHARAARRRRQHLGVELSVLRRQQRVRAGAARRQRGALQAVGVRDADRASHRRAAARGRRSGGRVRAGHRRRRDRRGAAATAGRRRVLHRLVRDRREDRRERRASA